MECLVKEKDMIEETVLLDMPRISVFKNVITEEEADYYVNKYSKQGMNPDAGLESREQTRGQITEEVEQRSISWDTDLEDREFFKKRLAEVVGIPLSHIEAGDIYRYQPGQYFGLHHDYPYDPKIVPYYENGGDRKATAIFWLTGGYKGGECDFPELGVTVKPFKCGMMYFEYDYDDEAINESTIHEAMPITEGEKWIAAFFMSNRPRVE
jgi:prolyl 4-hydroxylase